jgi:hypothetical protein
VKLFAVSSKSLTINVLQVPSMLFSSVHLLGYYIHLNTIKKNMINCDNLSINSWISLVA